MRKRSGFNDGPPSCEVSLICPVFNEESLVEVFLRNSREILRESCDSFEIIFVDDGSTDGTWETIQQLTRSHREVRAVKLARNYGKEIALTAGLAHARGSAHIPIDVDFQDPLYLIPSLVDGWRQGFDQVIPRRAGRHEGGLRKFGAKIFYGLVGWLTSHSTPEEVGDFRLLDSKITSRFLEYRESRRVNKVIFGQLGGSQKFVDFVRPAGSRQESGGQSFGKLLDLGLAAVSSNSIRLSRLVLMIGLIGLVLGIAVAMGVLVAWWAGIIEVPGQATVLMVGTIIVSVQLIASSFLGIMVAETLQQSQNRPMYFVDEVI